MLSIDYVGGPVEAVRVFDPEKHNGRALVLGPCVVFMLEGHHEVRCVVENSTVVLYLDGEHFDKGDPGFSDVESRLPARVVGGFLSCDPAVMTH